MQIMIDTDVENSTSLRRIGAMLAFVADQIDGGTAVSSGTVEPDSVRAYEKARETGTILPPVAIPPPPSVIIPPPPPPAAPSVGIAAALTVATPTTVVASTAVDVNAQLDKSGLPWDERIHSETPTINKSDGLWRMKRGIGDKRELIEAVEAELRAAGYGKQAAPTIPPPPAMVIPPPPVSVAASAQPAITSPPIMVIPLPPPPAPVAPGIPTSDQVDPNAGFKKLMQLVGGKMGPEGALRREVMLPLYQRYSVSGLPDFYKAEHRGKIPNVMAEINAILGV